MNDDDIQIIIESIKKVRKIRTKHILAEVERIRQDGNSEAGLKSLKKLENDLEEIVRKEMREQYYSKLQDKHSDNQ